MSQPQPEFHTPRALLMSAARFLLVIAAAVGIALAMGCGPSGAGQPQGITVGQTPPTLGAGDEWLNTPEGRPLVLSELHGQVVLVEFFAEWCPHCQAAEPRIVAAHENHAVEGLTVIGVHAPRDLDPEAVRSFLAEHGATSPVMLDADGSTYDAWGVTAVPHVVVVGRDGKVRWVGYPSDAMDAAVADALADE